MNIQEPLKINQIDLNKIVYPKIKNTPNKKIILIKYNEHKRLKNFVFQTPTLQHLFKPVMQDGYADIELMLTDKEVDNGFIDFIDKLEQKVKEDAQFNAHPWFNLSEENQTINFQKIVRESDVSKHGILKLKIIKNHDFETMIQLNNITKISIDNIPEASNCKMLLECYAVWVNANNNFGIFLRPILVSFKETNKNLYNYKFFDDEDENDSSSDLDDVPDTEYSNNIFMKMPSNKDKNNFDSTSQLNIGQLNNNQQSDVQSISLKDAKETIKSIIGVDDDIDDESTMINKDLDISFSNNNIINNLAMLSNTEKLNKLLHNTKNNSKSESDTESDSNSNSNSNTESDTDSDNESTFTTTSENEHIDLDAETSDK